MTWTLFVPGEPKSTQTGTVGRFGGRAIPMRRNTGWANRIAIKADEYRPATLLEGPLRATFRFQMPKPTSGKAAKRIHPTVRPDVDGLAKGLLDALNGIVYRDDAAVVELRLVKLYGGPPGVEITVEAITTTH
jgi:Holliday junction resolvase RusA-like endonuclease